MIDGCKCICGNWITRDNVLNHTRCVSDFKKLTSHNSDYEKCDEDDCNKKADRHVCNEH